MNEKLLKWRRILGILAVLLLVTSIGKSFVVQPLAHKIAPSNLHVHTINWDDCTQIGENTWDYTYKLPNVISVDEVLSVMTSWVSMEVCVDNTLILKYDDSLQEKGSGRQWIRLPLWSAGRTLHVIYTGDQKKVEVSAASDAYFGNAALVYIEFLSGKIYATVFAVCVCLMLILIAYFYRLMRRQMDRSMKHGIWYLGLFMFLAGTWIVADSQLLFLFMRNVAANTILTYSSLLFAPMFLVMYVSEMADHRIKTLDVLPVFYLLDFLFMFGCQLTHLISLDHSLFTLHLLILVSVLVIIVGGIRDVRKSHNKEMIKILTGFAGMAVCGVSAIIGYYISQTSNYSLLYCVGLSIFIFFFVWAAYERLYRLMGHNAKVMAYRRLAYKDIMTDLGNRAAFVKDKQALEADASVCFIVMDINNLKTTNDRFGHQEGDEMIRCAAVCVSQVFEGAGKIYRIGGDEFVVIARDVSEERAGQLLQQLEKVQEEKRKELQKPWQLQIAYGYAVRQEGKSFDELFREADDRMYECKRRMKNPSCHI